MTDGTTNLDTPIEEQVDGVDSTNEPNEYETKYKELQSEFTKKSQRLAELEKQASDGGANNSGLSDEEQELKKWVKKNTQEDFDRVKQEAKQEAIAEMQFSNLLQGYPELRGNEQAIRDLQAVKGGTYEEVAIQYGFTTQDKLSKARESRATMMGTDTKKAPDAINVADMTSEQYNKWKAGLTKSGSFDKVTNF